MEQHPTLSHPTLIYSFLFINELCYVWLINEVCLLVKLD